MNDRLQPGLAPPRPASSDDHEPIRDVIDCQFAASLTADLIIEPTEDPWRSGKRPLPACPRLALL